MANIALGKKLRELRVNSGYTQQEAADLLGLKSKSTLASWEVGKSEPDAVTFLRLCSLYKVPSISEVADALDVNIGKKHATSEQLMTRSREEYNILQYYRQMNNEGKTTLINLAEGMLLTGKYGVQGRFLQMAARKEGGSMGQGGIFQTLVTDIEKVERAAEALPEFPDKDDLV